MTHINGWKRKLTITSLIISIAIGLLFLGGLGYDRVSSSVEQDKQIQTNTNSIAALDLQAYRNEIMLMAIIRKFELEKTVQKELDLLRLKGVPK